MKNKIDVEKLYVGNPYFINSIMIEPFIQYESFGDTLNEVYVLTKKYLFEKTDDGYLLSGTKHIYDGRYPTSSYHSSGSCTFNIYSSWMSKYFKFRKSAILVGIEAKMFESIMKECAPSIKFGYFIPFKEYIKNTLHININGEISIQQAKLLLKLANLKRVKRQIKLDEYIGNKQLLKYNLASKTNDKIKKESWR